MRGPTGQENIYFDDLFANGISIYSLLFWSINCALGCANLCMVPILFYLACVKQSYHINLRLATSNLFLAFFLSSIGNVVYSLLVLTRTSDKLYDIYFVIFRFILSQGFASFKFVFLSIIIERTAATFFYKGYEYRAPLTFGIFVYLFGLIGLLMPAIYFIVKLSVYVNALIHIFQGLLTLTTVTKLYWINKKMRLRRNDATIHLSHRYQITENVRFLRIITPIILFEAFYDMATLISYTIQMAIDFNTQLYYPALPIMANAFVTIFYILYLKRDVKTRQKFWRIVCIKPIEVVPCNNEIKNVMGEPILLANNANIHFRQLEQFWTFTHVSLSKPSTFPPKMTMKECVKKNII